MELGWKIRGLDPETPLFPVNISPLHLHADPLKKGVATHSGTVAQEIPLTEESSGLQSMGLQKSRI